MPETTSRQRIWNKVQGSTEEIDHTSMEFYNQTRNSNSVGSRTETSSFSCPDKEKEEYEALLQQFQTKCNNNFSSE